MGEVVSLVAGTFNSTSLDTVLGAGESRFCSDNDGTVADADGDAGVGVSVLRGGCLDNAISNFTVSMTCY